MAGKKCTQVLEDGTQCDAWALHDKDKCFSHDGSSAEEKALAVRKGGATRQAVVETPLQQITINTPSDIIKLLSQTITEVRDGTLDLRIANTIGFLAGHLLRAFEITELNGKVEELKAIIFERGLTRRRNPYE